jgi:hypothetical protein
VSKAPGNYWGKSVPFLAQEVISFLHDNGKSSPPITLLQSFQLQQKSFSFFIFELLLLCEAL